MSMHHSIIIRGKILNATYESPIHQSYKSCTVLKFGMSRFHSYPPNKLPTGIGSPRAWRRAGATHTDAEKDATPAGPTTVKQLFHPRGPLVGDWTLSRCFPPRTTDVNAGQPTCAAY